MIGIVDVGGGLRDIYGAGVFDRCMDEKIKFDYCIGVSAGSANIASYASQQRGRNYRFYTEYSFRKEYMSAENLFKTGSYLNLDYVYSTLSGEGGEDALDYEAFSRYDGIIKTVATKASDGKAKYFDKNDYSRNDYHVVKASCCLPVACKPCIIDGEEYFDGGIADPIPIEKAFSDGCDKVVLILTKPFGELPPSTRNTAISGLIKHIYPRIAEQIALMNDKYNNAVRAAEKYAAEGKMLVVAPEDICGMKTLTKDKEKLDKLYRFGYDDAAKIMDFVKT